jgi:hypothetical protein
MALRTIKSAAKKSSKVPMGKAIAVAKAVSSGVKKTAAKKTVTAAKKVSAKKTAAKKTVTATKKASPKKSAAKKV